MIAYKSSVCGLSLFGKLEPFFALLKNLSLLKIEVSSNNSLKSLGRVFQVFNHCELDVTISHNIRVCLVFLFALDCALFVLEAWLVEVDFLRHDDTLNRN